MALLQVNGNANVVMMKPSRCHPEHPWVVLCYVPSVQSGKWVVWFADDDGNTAHGQYEAQFQDALTYFNSCETATYPWFS